MQAHVNRYTLLLRKNYLVEKSIIYEKETNINWESWSWKIHYLWMEGEFNMHFLLQVNKSTVREKVWGKSVLKDGMPCCQSMAIGILWECQ